MFSSIQREEIGSKRETEGAEERSLQEPIRQQLFSQRKKPFPTVAIKVIYN
jgi:hypothetical protein